MTPPTPQNPANPSPRERELYEAALRVVQENPVGLLTTADGEPHARYMVAAVGDRGLNRIFAMADLHSRKIHQINANPAVCWVFSSPQQQDVVTLTGKATVLPNQSSMYGRQVAWVPLMQATRTYAMASLTGSEETRYAAIETAVEHIHIISPRLGISRSHPVLFDPNPPAPKP